jgi:hypothetical protein
MHSHMGLLTILENDYNCAGMCTQSDFYMFSEVNRGSPEQSCSSALSDKLKSGCKKWGITFLIFGIFGLVCALVAGGLYFWASRRNEYNRTMKTKL